MRGFGHIQCFLIAHLICDYLIVTRCSYGQRKRNAAMWFSLSFMLLLARTSPKAVKYPTATSHNYTGSNVTAAICLAVCHFWPSGYLWFPRSSPGPYVTQRAVNFSTMTGRTARLEDVRKTSDARISITPDRHTLLHISQLLLGV